MKKSLFFFLSLLVLASCSGPKTVAVGAGTLTYDSSVWETFTTENTSGLSAKSDESCWIDLNGDLTQPLPSEILDQSEMQAGITLYNDPSMKGQPAYVSFLVDGETLFGRVSYDKAEPCVNNLLILAEAQ